MAADTARDLILQVTWCMFAEDLGLLTERVLHEVLGRMRRDPSLLDLDPLGQLFAFLGQEDPHKPGVYQPVPYANGGLFARPARVVLTPDEVKLLQVASDADWTLVEPAVFGGLLQSGLDRERRHHIGAHYTPKSKIDAAGYPAALDLVRGRVKPEREGNARKLYRERWWLFAENRPGMRRAVAPLPRWVAANEYGKRIVFAWQAPEVCPNNKTVTIATADNAVLGVLLSRAFAAWIVRWGGTLKADLHFTPTTVFETFPFPDDLTGDPGAEIAAATVALVDRRSQLCRDPEAPVGLTTLYNRVDDGAHRDLAKLHVALDRAVLRAYGWPLSLAQRTDEAEDDLLDHLYARNLAIAAGEVPGYEAFPLAAPPAADTDSLF